MSIWNKILLGLIAVATLSFFYAAARTLKTYQYWADSTARFETRLKKVRQEIVALQTADNEHPLEDKTVGIQQLRFDLGRILTNRGRIWSKCEKQKASITPKGRLETTVSTDEPGVTANMLLYVFEEGDDLTPGKYLGEYSVSGVSGNEVVLTSTTQPTKLQWTDVQASDPHKTAWVFYEMMPTDQHELFTMLPDELKKKWFPDDAPKKWFSEEYTNDGQKLADGTTYERPLRDYLEIIRDCEIKRTLFVDRLASVERDKTYLAAAADDAQKQQAFAEKEKALVMKDRDWEVKQRKAAADDYAVLQIMLNNNGRAVTEAIARNAELAQHIAKIQKDAADAIDRRMRNVAQNGAGAN